MLIATSLVYFDGADELVELKPIYQKNGQTLHSKWGSNSNLGGHHKVKADAVVEYHLDRSTSNFQRHQHI